MLVIPATSEKIERLRQEDYLSPGSNTNMGNM